jgi:flagellin
MGKSLSKLSSGKQIESAQDEPSNYGVSAKLRDQLKGLEMAKRNAMDGISYLQTVEGTVEEVTSMIQRMRELSVKSANGSYELIDRENMNNEFVALREEIDRITKDAEFNGRSVLDGAISIKIHSGANMNERMDVDIPEINSVTMGLDTIDILSSANANDAIGLVDDAMKVLMKTRSQIGAYQNNLESSITKLDGSVETFTKSLSKIEDVDMALEMVEYTKHQLLSQAGTAILSQANSRPESLLKILN